MKKIKRDTWLGIALFLTLVLATIVAAIQQSVEPALPSMTSISSEPNGTRALRLWLEDLGYQVGGEAQSSFNIPDRTATLLMLEPLGGVLDDEWQIIDEFVENGGTLLLAGGETGSQLAIRHFNFRSVWHPQMIDNVSLQTPVLHSPAIGMPIHVNALSYLESTRTDFVTLLAADDLPITVTFAQGAGRVILSSSAFPFSNRGLKAEGNPSYVINFFSNVQTNGMIWFDEWHHGLRMQSKEILGTEGWLRYTPAGQSLIFFAIVIFIYLLLQGKRFGRPIPLPRTKRRRAPLEYITAIANLSRRARHRTTILRRYSHWLKRGLGKRYHLDPMLDDNIYIDRLSQFDPDLDRKELGQLLTRLKDKNVSESEFVELGSKVARWIREE